MAHIVEKFLGELILYFMDLAVAQTGTMLYRFHDDLWLVGKPSQCAAAWKTMTELASIMGLEFNKQKTGSVYLTKGEQHRDAEILKVLPEGPVGMDFLVLDPAVGNWIINHEHVWKHVEQLQKQLTGSKSALQWINTWNSCIGRFFGYTFGEPAHCFGVSHVDRILETHRDIQKFLFDDKTRGSVTEHLRRMLYARFGADDIPESFLYLPEHLGGLGVKNPFLPLLLVLPNLCKDPETRMRAFFEAERAEYEEARKRFAELTDREKRGRYKRAFREDEDEHTEPLVSWTNAQTFMTFEEFAQFREFTSTSLLEVYNYFLDQPSKAAVLPWSSEEISKALAVSCTPVEGTDLPTQLESDDEAMWMLSFFVDQLFAKFEGLKVVDKHWLPMGVLKALKSKKVTWQMVL